VFWFAFLSSLWRIEPHFFGIRSLCSVVLNSAPNWYELQINIGSTLWKCCSWAGIQEMAEYRIWDLEKTPIFGILQLKTAPNAVFFIKLI
jgi:hypothetical protein